MKRAVMALLAAIMLLSSVVGIIVFLWPQASGPDPDPDLHDPFWDIPDPRIATYRHMSFLGSDITGIDLGGDGEVSYTYTYQDITLWPPAERMPPGFDPLATLEDAKYLGLGLGNLHSAGVTGKGVSVAIIDEVPLLDHVDYGGRLIYHQVDPDLVLLGPPSQWGTACAGIIAGKNGVAPGATLHYFAVSDIESYEQCVLAIEMLSQFQSTADPEDRIRILSISQGLDFQKEGAADYFGRILDLEEQGVIVVYPGMDGLNLTAAGCPPAKDRDDPQNYEIWTWTKAKQTVHERLREVASFDAGRAVLKEMMGSGNIDALQADAVWSFLYMMEIAKYDDSLDYATYLLSMEADFQEGLAVPSEFITAPGPLGPNSYIYYGSGGLGWATPYVAGLLTLGLSANPEASRGELLDALLDTATPFQGDLVLVNPKGFIDALR